ncbi:formimidoylglutamase [Metabacillus iocasae]|uniref:Formimidoylglutamase n=1 Tax=Priestia iocasae TaxID=2291674 RepID=A0ABS2QS72_9BACI|nr:formimidoylglutamase [Metabacillus iocasae]MBM7702063.1 formiminoglutamase [Metabacillus iocasae]
MSETFPYLKSAGKAQFVDRHVRKAGELLQQRESASVTLLGAPLSKSSISHSGALLAPTTIRTMLHSYSTYSIEEEIELDDIQIADLGDICMHPTDIIGSQSRIYETVSAVTEKYPDSLFVLLGGDHSVSYPSIKGFSTKKGAVGVIQFDAHHDLRNLEDGGPTNGTPFRSLVESGVMKGEHLVQIGIRDFSNSKPYSDFAKEHGVKVYTMKEVASMSISSIVKESVACLKNKVDAIYISVDMDVLDQAFAPGCPAIGPGGMDSATLLEAIMLLGKEEMVQGMDIVEIDPTLDFRDMTSRVAAHVILTFLKGKKKAQLL